MLIEGTDRLYIKGICIFGIIILFLSLSSAFDGVQISIPSSSSSTVLVTNISINSSVFWGGYNYADFDMLSILSLAYNHTTSSLTLGQLRFLNLSGTNANQNITIDDGYNISLASGSYYFGDGSKLTGIVTAGSNGSWNETQGNNLIQARALNLSGTNANQDINFLNHNITIQNLTTERIAGDGSGIFNIVYPNIVNVPDFNGYCNGVVQSNRTAIETLLGTQIINNRTASETLLGTQIINNRTASETTLGNQLQGNITYLNNSKAWNVSSTTIFQNDGSKIVQIDSRINITGGNNLTLGGGISNIFWNGSCDVKYTKGVLIWAEGCDLP